MAPEVWRMGLPGRVDLGKVLNTAPWNPWKWLLTAQGALLRGWGYQGAEGMRSLPPCHPLRRPLLSGCDAVLTREPFLYLNE